MKGNIKKILKLALPTVTFAVPVLLYVFLLGKRASGMLAYAGGDLWVVMGIGAACSICTFVLLERVLSSFSEQIEEDEEWQWEEETFLSERCEDSLAMEEYPELFLKREAYEEQSAVPSYRENLKKAFEACREQGTVEENDEIIGPDEDVQLYLDSFTESEKKEEKSLYEDVPVELPEGYVPYTQEAEDEDEQEQEQEDGDEELCESHPRAFSRVMILALCIIISFSSAFVFSFSYTGVSREGIFVSSVFSQREYKWGDAKEYSVDTTFFGKLRISLTMKDGTEAEIVPHSLSFTDMGEGSFESLYEYAVFADEKLSKAGAQKRISDEDAIIREYENRDDGTFEYVKKIIDMEHEHD